MPRPPPLIEAGDRRLRRCRHGLMLFHVHDAYIGRSLDRYGEYMEAEVALFRQVLRPGHVAIDAGANIGAHTVPLAARVGAGGAVLAFEPQRPVFQLLCANAALNGLGNVHAHCAALGARRGSVVVPRLDYGRPNNFGGLALGGYEKGERVPVLTVDGLELPRCHFIKVDVEGMEDAVLEGARATIARHRPLLYVENDRKNRARALITLIRGFGYRLYWHVGRLFSPDNFYANAANVFGNVTMVNMLCVPEERPQRIDAEAVADGRWHDGSPLP